MKPQKIKKSVRKEWIILIGLYLSSSLLLKAATASLIFGRINLVMLFSGLWGGMTMLFITMSFFFLHNQEVTKWEK